MESHILVGISAISAVSATAIISPETAKELGIALVVVIGVLVILREVVKGVFNNVQTGNDNIVTSIKELQATIVEENRSTRDVIRDENKQSRESMMRLESKIIERLFQSSER